MANLSKGLKILTIPKKGGKTEGEAGGKTGLTPDQKFSLVLYGTVAVIVALLIALMQIIYNSYNEYSKTIREYNDNRIINLENRVNTLESVKKSTESATQKR